MGKDLDISCIEFCYNSYNIGYVGFFCIDICDFDNMCSYIDGCCMDSDIW